MYKYGIVNAENKMNGLTPSEMAEKLGIPVNTLRKRITRLGIKPLSQEAVYDFDVLEKLRNVKPKGWPKKQPAEKAKPESKPKK